MTQTGVRLQDREPEGGIREEVLRGLHGEQKTLPCKFLYDERGCDLFERICELEEYYPTRTERGIMRESAAEMAAHLGPRVLLAEFGSGSSTKTRILLDALEDPVAYVPVDIARELLLSTADVLDRRHPQLEVLPVCADFTAPFALPEPRRRPERRAIYFPGSTIGNFDPPGVVDCLSRMRALVGAGGGVLIGVDLRKDPAILEAAYDDRGGVTAAFNQNLLLRINRELGADFDIEGFAHRAVWDEKLGRVEMHLVSRRPQTVTVAGERFVFRLEEWIHTENSYKFTLPGFASLARRAGLGVERVWKDADDLFSVQYLTPSG